MCAPTEYFALARLRERDLPCPAPSRPAAGRTGGFTLIEILVALAIAAVLAAIAVPSYADYLRRGRIVEALGRLADHRVRMEQFFLDHRRYDDGAGHCGAPPPAAAGAFALDCTAAAETYVVRATGLEAQGMQGFVYTIDEADARRTPGVPDGWVGSDRCWVIRRDGTCS